MLKELLNLDDLSNIVVESSTHSLEPQIHKKLKIYSKVTNQMTVMAEWDS